MKRITIGLLLATLAAPAMAQDPAPATPEAKLAAYNRCMMLAAVRASYTQAANHEIYAIARAACAAARTSATLDGARQPVYLAAVDAADATRATHLASWVGELRDRRRAVDSLYGMNR